MVSRARAKAPPPGQSRLAAAPQKSKSKAEEKAEQQRRLKFFKDQRTAFMAAVEANDVDRARELVHCPDYPIWATGFQMSHPMARARAASLAHVAARNASLELLALLIDHAGFSVNVREGLRHYTPLHEAVRHSAEPAAAYLLDRGADTALISRDHNSTPLSLAMRNRNRPMVIVLLSRGTAHGAKRAGIDFVTYPFLHVAALNDDAVAVARFLDLGAPPDTPSKGGYTAVHLAAHFGCFQAMRVLLQHARNPASPVLQNEWLYCALHFAAMLERADGVKLLLEAGGTDNHIDLRDKELHTPLALSLYYNRQSCAEALLAAGANPNMLDSARAPFLPPDRKLQQGGRSLLHYLVERRNTNMPMLRLLLAPPSTAIKSDVDALNKLKETPLASAMAWGNFPASRELLAAGANLLPARTARAPLSMLAGYLSSGLATDADWANARALAEEQLATIESLVEAHKEGTSELSKAARDSARTALILAGDALSGHLNVEVAVRHEEAQAAIELFRAAPAKAEPPTPPADAATATLMDKPALESDAGAVRKFRKVTFRPPAPPAGAGCDGGGMDFPPFFEAFDGFKQLQSAVDASAPVADGGNGSVGGAGLDDEAWASEWADLSDIFKGDFPMADLGGGGFAADCATDGAWLAPLPEIVHLEPPSLSAAAAAEVAGGGAKAAPAKKRKARGGNGGSAAARQKQQRREALDAANSRRRWSKAAVARADAAKAYAVQARLDGLAWEAAQGASAADAATAAAPAAAPPLPRREQGRVALEAKQRLQLMWETFAPAAAAYAKASEAASSALPAAVVQEIKVLQKRMAALQKFLAAHPPRPAVAAAAAAIVGAHIPAAPQYGPPQQPQIAVAPVMA